MIENKQIIVSSEEKSIVVDLNNFLLADKDSTGKAKIENVALLRKYLKDRGYNKIFCISSSSFWKRVNKKRKYDQLVKKKVILKAPALVDMDWFILLTAQQLNCDILSNDKFREYWDEFGGEWIQNKRKTFMFIEGIIIVKL